jgi:hypothetical protein
MPIDRTPVLHVADGARLEQFAFTAEMRDDTAASIATESRSLQLCWPGSAAKRHVLCVLPHKVASWPLYGGRSVPHSLAAASAADEGHSVHQGTARPVRRRGQGRVLRPRETAAFGHDGP